MANDLEYLISLQKQFQDKYKFHRPSHEWAAAMAAECGELWGESGGKWWKKKPIEDSKVKEELADILHFFLGFMIDYNIDAKTLFEEYQKKLKENYRRQEQGY